jgi:hypothetical protein
VAEAVGQRHHARAHLVADLDRRLDRPGRAGDTGPTAVDQPAGARVVGVHQQRAAIAALHQQRQVVHPRVVAAQRAAADQHQRRRRRRQRRLEARHVRDDQRGRQRDLPGRRAQHDGQPRHQRAQIEPVRRGAQRRPA